MLPKRTRGRPRKEKTEAKQNARQFLSWVKSSENVRLLNAGHATYVRENGVDTNDTEVLREALRHYIA